MDWRLTLGFQSKQIRIFQGTNFMHADQFTVKQKRWMADSDLDSTTDQSVRLLRERLPPVFRSALKLLDERGPDIDSTVRAIMSITLSKAASKRATKLVVAYQRLETLCAESGRTDPEHRVGASREIYAQVNRHVNAYAACLEIESAGRLLRDRGVLETSDSFQPDVWIEGIRCKGPERLIGTISEACIRLGCEHIFDSSLPASRKRPRQTKTAASAADQDQDQDRDLDQDQDRTDRVVVSVGAFIADSEFDALVWMSERCALERIGALPTVWVTFRGGMVAGRVDSSVLTKHLARKLDHDRIAIAREMNRRTSKAHHAQLTTIKTGRIGGHRASPQPTVCLICECTPLTSARMRKSGRCEACNALLLKSVVVLRDDTKDGKYALMFGCQSCTPKCCLRDLSFFYYKPHSRRQDLTILTHCKAHERAHVLSDLGAC
jgi:hypothetical protein